MVAAETAGVLVEVPVCASGLSKAASEDFCGDDEDGVSLFVFNRETRMSPVGATGVVSSKAISFTT